MVNKTATNNNFAVGEQCIAGEVWHSKCGGVKHNVASESDGIVKLTLINISLHTSKHPSKIIKKHTHTH